ncbi:MAG: phosphatidylserine/phosphatidylglycerophosphate/cardiolipin synthase family protein [Bacteroidales bacterium]|jgi:cardiolipin synthase|nr:phosphatidylserine/phosphatidylglycerophosphate/cardiolipin synthase family protein [Bacteroidales bacterium]MDI9592834.1 phosphatidylserine/phosphatidylglycerophosphate/cardiolipin synthase family protein [Bacteroidota bacterium]HOF80762.1 phosphatidylserine/phosphatidylglycerophosphate/cardiolipin synthase family protein [Bacteroidales bacterium]HOR76106.1 phosphatidylserine/phosphatidylglycerophosphate/cardiolipin synthase family protein [Bacteroidales bacterium]HPL11497.1 phosphatidylser
MAKSDHTNYQLFDDPIRFYNVILDDIASAKKYVFIQMFKFSHQAMGMKFRDSLTAVALRGVEVKLLIDSWGGSSFPYNFFDELVSAGGEVRFFEKIKINIDIFTRSHRRNHRKLIIIDDIISYIGSSNISDYNLIWRESMLRIYGSIAVKFKKVFNQDFSAYKKYFRYKESFTRIIRHGDMEILRDSPSVTRQKIKKRYEEVIKNALKEVIIVTPYFLPGFNLRKVLMDAANRGVEVKVIIPKRSDIRMVDILHGRYLEILNNSNVKFLYFTKHNLHAKLLLVDNEKFSIGSPNFDYRSFRYMHEIVLFGTTPSIIKLIREFIIDTQQFCEPFDYEAWQRRPAIQKFFEWVLLPFRHLL